MNEGYDNVVNRINQINERIREIQNLGRKALYGRVNSVSEQTSGGDTTREEAFSAALEQALLEQALESGDVLNSGMNSGTEEEGTGSFDLTALNALNQGVSLPAEAYEPGGSDASYNRLIQLTAGYFGIDSNLIRAVIRQESGFNPSAVSPKGAMGLMQLMPETAREMGVDNAFDPAKNIYGGTKYLQQMLSRYKGDLDRALAAYNAGPATVDSAGGIPEISETKNYIEKVRQFYREYSKNPLNRS